MWKGGWVRGADESAMNGRRVATEPVIVGEIGRQSPLHPSHQFSQVGMCTDVLLRYWCYLQDSTPLLFPMLIRRELNIIDTQIVIQKYGLLSKNMESWRFTNRDTIQTKY